VIIGIGTDLLEVSRVKRTLNKQVTFKESVFTSQEINYCEGKKHKDRHYASRFAAKEAFMKALGIGWRYGIRFTEIEIKNNELGKPELFLKGKAKTMADELGVKEIHVSISHLKDLACAYVIITK
jgi:holo-[acyl-carrier protein] synthase